MNVGTVEAVPGELAFGHLTGADLPTGIEDRLPVIIAAGEEPGPELWITATIHGDEANGLAVAQDVMRAELPGELRGTVVCLPNLNPAGLRCNDRRPYYGGDPNRCFPDFTEDTREKPPNVVELMYQSVYDAFADSADTLIDLHTANISSIPFNIRHRVLYGDHRSETEARELASRQGELMDAFGLPVVNQYHEYRDRDLHRTTTGAALNNAGIPAMTVELGQHSVINDDVVAAGIAGCYRVMHAMEMIDELPPEIDAAAPVYESPVDYPVKRDRGPHTPEPGIVRHRLRAGDAFSRDDPIADIVTSHGRHITTITADADGYLINRCVGAAVYENDQIGSFVARDEGDIVIPMEAEEA